MGTWVRRDIRRSTLDIPNDRVALRPVVPHLKLLQERGTFLHVAVAHSGIRSYFNLLDSAAQLLSGVVCHGAASALRARGGRTSVYVG